VAKERKRREKPQRAQGALRTEGSWAPLKTRHTSHATRYFLPPRALLVSETGRNFSLVITLDKKRAAGAVLLELLAERHRLREALEVLDRQHGEGVRAPWKRLNAFNNEEKPELYDAWLEHQGLSEALRAAESEIAGIRHGDFSFA